MQNQLTSDSRMLDQISVYNVLDKTKKVYSMSDYTKTHTSSKTKNTDTESSARNAKKEQNLMNKIYGGYKSSKFGQMNLEVSSSSEQEGGCCEATDNAYKNIMETKEEPPVVNAGDATFLTDSSQVVNLSSISSQNEGAQSQAGGNNSSSSSTSMNNMTLKGGKKSSVKRAHNEDKKLERKAYMTLFLSSRFERYSKNNALNQLGGKGEGLAIHRAFIAYVQKQLGVKGGPALQILGSGYKKIIKGMKEWKDETDAQKITDEAQKLFDKELKDNKDKIMKEYNRIVKELEENRKNKKKNKKAAAESDSDE